MLLGGQDTRQWVRDHVRVAAHYLLQRGSIRRRDFVGRMEQYVADRFASPIGLAEAAEHANMNRQYFCTVFKSAFGTTFGDYLTQHRVHRASELLTATTRSAAEIASEVGYTNSRSFIRAFRQAKGLTPTRYRLSMTASSAESSPGSAGSPAAVQPATRPE